MHMNLTLTRLLNCVFGQKSHIEMLEGGNLKENQLEDDQNNKEGKKKKKKNKNSKEAFNATDNLPTSNSESENLIKVPLSIYASMKPSEIW